MPSKPKQTKESYLKAIEGSGGIIKLIAAKLKVTRQTVTARIAKDDELQAAVEAEKTDCLDLAEENIKQALKARNMKVTMWYLDRKGKDRGYGNQLNVEGTLENKVDVVLYFPDNGRDMDDTDGITSKPVPRIDAPSE